jgi:endonuclease/exonuclease/phosphatase family metal-dependent hydrolase
VAQVLHHDLAPHVAELCAFEGTRALEKSVLYRRIEPGLRRVLEAVVAYDAPAPAIDAARPFFRAVAWNIERGLCLDGVIDALAEHPILRDADVLLLTELDFGMARTHNRDVPGEIARRLGYHGVFVPCYFNLSKGSGLEQRNWRENTFGLHGNAIFSRWPIRDATAIRLPNGKDKMRGREKRIGSQQAVVATVDLPVGPVRCVCLHLDAHSSQRHRRIQMRRVLDAVDEPPGSPRRFLKTAWVNPAARRRADAYHPVVPILIGGDWNTSTHNTSRAAWAIIGFWIRVAIGVEYCLRAHYPHPDRFFERRLFRLLERRGYDYRRFNEPGGCTLHHCILSEKDRDNLRDWLPAWCLRYVERALEPFDGRCALKLDWFAARGLEPARHPAALPPTVVRGVGASPTSSDAPRLSDHDPIVLDFVLTQKRRG